jgi:hypothetical protein
VLIDQALITRDRAIASIGSERLALLRDVQRHGWRAWEAIRATREGAGLSASARARIVYDATVRRAVECFPAETVEWRHGLLVLDLGDALGRFKKLSADLVPSGIATGQATLFAEQAHVAAPMQLAIWPPKPMLIVGYVVDRLGTAIERQVLVLSQCGRVIWWHDLAGDDGVMGFPIPVGPLPVAGPRPAIVRSSRIVEEAGEEAR